MPSSSTGKWVARAGATGGSRAYRGKVPTNWYAALAVIVILGLLSIGFSRYEYFRPTVATQSQRAWYAGLSFIRCGAVQPTLPAAPSTTGLSTPGSGVVTVSIKDRSQGTLGRFASGYPGLTLTASSLGYPGSATLHNGETCPSGTPDAGKKGHVIVVHWGNFSQAKGTRVTGDPTALPLTNGALVTVAFVPAGASVPKPPQSTITAVLNSISGQTPTTSTTTPTTPSTTAPSGAATTTTPSTTAPAGAATTTSPPSGSTTTSK